MRKSCYEQDEEYKLRLSKKGVLPMTKKVYRVRNWKDYNQGLVNRGSINFWFSEECIRDWHNTDRSGKRGRPLKYNDLVIECGLTLKALFGLTFRGTEGFIRSLIEMMHLNLEVPDYSLLCKRQKNLSVTLPTRQAKANEKINVLVDSTGLKVYGEGEWKVRQHGTITKRLWRKLHIALNSDTQEIEAFKLTDLGVQDWKGLELLVEDIEKDIASITGDGAYDRLPCYELAEKNHCKLITPPQSNARTSIERGSKIKKEKRQYLRQRDETILQVRELGRAEWKRGVGYHKRSLAETVMFRIKTILHNRLSTRMIENQLVEAAIWCKIINRMTQLGMPISVSIDE